MACECMRERGGGGGLMVFLLGVCASKQVYTLLWQQWHDLDQQRALPVRLPPHLPLVLAALSRVAWPRQLPVWLHLWHQIRASSSAVCAPRLMALFRHVRQVLPQVVGDTQHHMDGSERESSPPARWSPPARASFDSALVTYADVLMGVGGDVHRQPSVKPDTLAALWSPEVPLKQVKVLLRWIATTATQPQAVWMCDRVQTFALRLLQDRPVPEWFASCFYFFFFFFCRVLLFF